MKLRIVEKEDSIRIQRLIEDNKWIDMCSFKSFWFGIGGKHLEFANIQDAEIYINQNYVTKVLKEYDIPDETENK